MSGMDLCQRCEREMVKEPRVKGDPALDCGGDCLGCIAEVEEDAFDNRPAINRAEYPDIDDVLAEVYGGTTAPMMLEAGDLSPLQETPDGTPI